MSRIAPCLVFLVVVGLSAAARATLLYGEVEAVADDWTSWNVFTGEAAPPFGLDRDSLVGTRATIRFWIDTSVLPADQNDLLERTTYFTNLAEPEWLTMEIEINGVTSHPGLGESVLDLFEWVGPQNPTDSLQLATDRYAPNGRPDYPESLQIFIDGNDLGPAGVIPTSFDLSTFAPIRNGNVYTLSRSEFDSVTGEVIVKSTLNLDFDLISARMYAVPEPDGVTLLACLVVVAAASRCGRRASA